MFRELLVVIYLESKTIFTECQHETFSAINRFRETFGGGGGLLVILALETIFRPLY
jgi:hypothetical protein